jgi:uncharacterized membrane protein
MVIGIKMASTTIFQPIFQVICKNTLFRMELIFKMVQKNFKNKCEFLRNYDIVVRQPILLIDIIIKMSFNLFENTGKSEKTFFLDKMLNKLLN